MAADDLITMDVGVCLLLGETKRGVEQKVALRAPWVARLVAAYTCDAKTKRNRSLNQLMRCLRRLAVTLDEVELELTSRSFRRGRGQPPRVARGEARRCVPRGTLGFLELGKENLRQSDTAVLRSQLELRGPIWEKICRMASCREGLVGL